MLCILRVRGDVYRTLKTTTSAKRIARGDSINCEKYTCQTTQKTEHRNKLLYQTNLIQSYQYVFLNNQLKDIVTLRHFITLMIY